ncbi:hypothetical protein Ancab_037680 [Ancistrocladus abbreviatus]
MVDHQSTVCCMCGDVGFSDKLFHCTRCRFRFQHSYCSNYYTESSERVVEVCDWCRSEERSLKHGGSAKKSTVVAHGAGSRSEYSGERIKQQDRAVEESGGGGGGSSNEKGKNSNSGVPSPRPSTRRYKLLKDVMC